MKPLRVGLIGYDGVQALDIIGPFDAFTIAEIESDNGQRRPCYEVIIVGITNKPFRAESGVSFQPHTTLGKAPTLDTAPQEKKENLHATGKRVRDLPITPDKLM